jgi:hypothetical protein
MTDDEGHTPLVMAAAAGACRINAVSTALQRCFLPFSTLLNAISTLFNAISTLV